MKKTCWSILLLAVGALSCFAGSRVAPFSDLPRDDKIVVLYISTGCFHFFTYEFTYSSAGLGSLEVEELHMQWSKPQKTFVERSREFLGRVLLEKGEAKKLDSLIDFYRHNTDTGCTTIDTIGLFQIHNGNVVAEETFVDASGATIMRPGFLTFGQMANAVKKIAK